MKIFKIIGLWLKKTELQLKADLAYLESQGGKVYAAVKADIKKK